MTDVNWWLAALAFILGLAFTLVLMIRRVRRQVPVSASVTDTPGGEVPTSGATSFAGGRSGADSEPATTEVPGAAEQNETRQKADEQKDDEQ